MRIRHKIPSIFSLSMVDVLCCALGCVIMLWLIGAKQSDDETTEMREQAASELKKVEDERDATQSRLASTEVDKTKLGQHVHALMVSRDRAVVLEAQLADRIRELERTRDGLASALTGQQSQARDLEAKLKSSLTRVTSLEGEVKSAAKTLETQRDRVATLDKQLSGANAKLKDTDAKLKTALADADTQMKSADARLKGMRSDLDAERNRSASAEKRLVDLNRDIDSRKKELTGLERSLTDASAVQKKLESNLAQRDKELAVARLFKDRLDAAEERERFLEKQLKDRTATIADAVKSLTLLKHQAATLRSERDGRFAGIALTGKRVIFLVDCSGSMEMLDEDTPAPKKWEEVCGTVGRLMKSLTEMDRYQIIVFSTKATFPLGDDGKWRTHDASKSPAEAVAALEKIKPKGGTNMYSALDAAMKYRADGLDTIYLLSDGLPNQGEGITEAQRTELKEVDRGLVLGKYIRNKLKTEWNKPGKEQVRINTIGFFYESPDLGSFLWALARENNGSFVGMSKP